MDPDDFGLVEIAIEIDFAGLAVGEDLFELDYFEVVLAAIENFVLVVAAIVEMYSADFVEMKFGFFVSEAAAEPVVVDMMAVMAELPGIVVLDILVLVALEAVAPVVAVLEVAAMTAVLVPFDYFGFDTVILVMAELVVPVATDSAVLDMFVPVALVDTAGIDWDPSDLRFGKVVLGPVLDNIELVVDFGTGFGCIALYFEAVVT